jgi:hypothetical protein
MDRSGCRKIVLLLAVLAIALAAGSQVASAQTTDVYTVDYYANANCPGGTPIPVGCIGITAAPDATVRVINPGALGNPSEGTDLCALIYVFDANQELSECCGCFVSANALLTLSVNKNLTNNPFLGGLLHTGVIKIVSAQNPGFPTIPCDPTATIVPKTTLRAWATHVQNKVGAAFPITEGESQAATLGTGEQADLAEDCAFATSNGGGQGVCKCPPGH